MLAPVSVVRVVRVVLAVVLERPVTLETPATSCSSNRLHPANRIPVREAEIS